MKKIVIHSAGGYETLKLEEHPEDPITPGSVRVDVKACGVNYADVCVRWGIYESAKKYVGWPITPGFEFSGVVSQTGPGVKRFKVGDRVLGVTRFGAYASEIVVPEERIFRIPDSWSFEEAAGFPAVYMTAYHALHQCVVLRKGMSILVHSAAGGVGSAIVQLGKLAQCRVVGVVGASHKVDTVKALGADAVIDKSREDLWKRADHLEPEGYDLVLDANGPATLRESYARVKSTGRLIVYGFHTMLPQASGNRLSGRMNWGKVVRGWIRMPRFNPLEMTSANKGVVGFNLSFLFDRRDLMEEGMQNLMAWANDGKIRVAKVTAMPIAEVGKAHQLIESGQSVGKIVLRF
jgi:NADPH:quinone reductase-like Zn-dependent oxidoreductase